MLRILDWAEDHGDLAFAVMSLFILVPLIILAIVLAAMTLAVAYTLTGPYLLLALWLAGVGYLCFLRWREIVKSKSAD